MVFKKRPRNPHRAATPRASLNALSKNEPGYWRRRLFKNTFTYKGRRVEVNRWSVKIQHQGRRKTFSLDSRDPIQATEEACGIYQTIVEQGWEGLTGGGGGGESASDKKAKSIRLGLLASELEDWNSRLIQRRSLDQAPVSTAHEFSARIVHAREGWYFPLGTSDEIKAAARAKRIHQAVVARGWEFAHRKFSRELTLALRWLDDPVAWTYITIHTQPEERSQLASSKPASPSAFRVALVEPEVALRRALVVCINSQDGFHCDWHFSSAAEAIPATARLALDFVLLNHSCVSHSGAACLEEWQRAKPGLAGLFYSVFEDSDQLFKATPGGAMGYLLKRTSPQRIFDPLAGAVRPLTREQIAAQVRGYFQRLSASLPAGPPSRELAMLTPREHEILGLLSRGQLAKEIADTLGISVWTVHGHVKSIFEKLNVHTRTEAVVKFLQK